MQDTWPGAFAFLQGGVRVWSSIGACGQPWHPCMQPHASAVEPPAPPCSPAACCWAFLPRAAAALVAIFLVLFYWRVAFALGTACEGRALKQSDPPSRSPAQKQAQLPRPCLLAELKRSILSPSVSHAAPLSFFKWTHFLALRKFETPPGRARATPHYALRTRMKTAHSIALILLLALLPWFSTSESVDLCRCLSVLH